jgi:hypothetical protein
MRSEASVAQLSSFIGPEPIGLFVKLSPACVTGVGEKTMPARSPRIEKSDAVIVFRWNTTRLGSTTSTRSMLFT